MKFSIEAACGCNKGIIRANNEDNFYFNDKCLEETNEGLRNPVFLGQSLTKNVLMAVFDGIGGESFGEVASYTAARQMQQMDRSVKDFFVPEKKYLKKVIQQVNDAVVLSKNEYLTENMGATVVALYFTLRHVYVCNVGDSRAYRLRDGEFLQISQDHVEKKPDEIIKKAPLTQYLGMDPDEVIIEPYICKGELRKGDIYLLCSDGLTDMVNNLNICDILIKNVDVIECVDNLIKTALENGGRDNVTIIVCKVV